MFLRLSYFVLLTIQNPTSAYVTSTSCELTSFSLVQLRRLFATSPALHYRFARHLCRTSWLHLVTFQSAARVSSSRTSVRAQIAAYTSLSFILFARLAPFLPPKSHQMHQSLTDLYYYARGLCVQRKTWRL